MPEPTMAASGTKTPGIYRCTVTDVHRTRYTVDVRTDGGRDFPDCQVLSGYYHVMGEGRKSLPSVGARCMIAISSDDTPPFVLGFIDLPASVSKANQDAEAGIESPGASEEETEVSFAGAAPEANPGDQLQFGRTGSFFFFRSSGVVQLGSSAFCQRLFLPIRNKIIDFAENYALATAGGDFSIESLRMEDSDDADQGTVSRWCMNRKLGDDFASAKVELGDLGDGVLHRVTIAPVAVDRADGSLQGNSVYIWEVNDVGDLLVESGDVEWEAGSFELSTTGALDMTAGSTHTLNALVSQENLTSAKKITAPSILLLGKVSFGTGGLNPLCGNANALYGWCVSVATALNAAGIVVPAPPPIALPNLMG